MEQFVVAASSGEVLLFTAALGWAARRMIVSHGKLADEVHKMRTDLTVTQVTGPDLIARVGKAEAAIVTNMNAITAVRVQIDQHERWHERMPGRPLPE